MSELRGTFRRFYARNIIDSPVACLNIACPSNHFVVSAAQLEAIALLRPPILRLRFWAPVGRRCSTRARPHIRGRIVRTGGEVPHVVLSCYRMVPRSTSQSRSKRLIQSLFTRCDRCADYLSASRRRFLLRHPESAVFLS